MANDKKKPSIASQGAVMRRVLRYIGPHVSLVVLSLALCLISVALTLYVPILVGRAVDCIVGPNAVDFAALKPILLTIAVCIVVTAAAQWLMNALHTASPTTPCATSAATPSRTSRTCRFPTSTRTRPATPSAA